MGGRQLTVHWPRLASFGTVGPMSDQAEKLFDDVSDWLENQLPLVCGTEREGAVLEEAVRRVVQSPFSRLPVYRDSLDNVVGIVHTKDLARLLMAGNTDTTLAGVMRPITSIHESMTADRILRHLRERRSHHALVVDEFGGTAGLLTLEDVLSELIGNVGDEFKPGGPITETLPDGRVRLPGSMPVDDAAVVLETAWDSDAATIGGMVTEALGHLPAPGEAVAIGDYEFEVERVAGLAPQSVLASWI